MEGSITCEKEDFMRQKTRKVKLTYFKESGKYYTEGIYQTKVPEYYDFDVYSEVRMMARTGKLPGLVAGCVEFDILISGSTVVPHLLKASRTWT
jgi:hypothetical protein